jgi:protein gp37
MSEKTQIAWCDSTLNFWEGCTKISAGCASCYAEARDKRFTGGAHWGKGAPRRKSKSAVKDALAFNRKPWICDECGAAHRRRIFSLSLGDWLDPEVPIEWLAEMLDTIRQCDQVVWILCTKRPENFFKRLMEVEHDGYNQDGTQSLLAHWLHSWMVSHEIPKNIILIASVENQEMADKRIPELLKIPAACHGLSVEPMLGPVNLHLRHSQADVVWRRAHGGSYERGHGIRWAIFGGESGPGARPCNVEWIRAGVKQCQAAGVACFCKQLGAQPMGRVTPDSELSNFAKSPTQYIKDKKGADPAEWPADLCVQQWPKGF